MTIGTATRGTSNRDVRGSTATRRARRTWLVQTYQADVKGFCRCYRCGRLLYNPDTLEVHTVARIIELQALSLTVDRITPGCQGGTYRRTNIRPACGPCNSETGGSLRSPA